MTTTTEAALYRLLAWLSPGFPVGAFSYSHALEAAVEAGTVRDRATLESWVAAVLAHGSGRLDADLLRDAWQAAASPLPLPGEGQGEGMSEASCIPSPRPAPASGRGSEVAARGDAHRGTAELALEARAQGEAFVAACRAWDVPGLDAWAGTVEAAGHKPTYAVAVGAAAALAGVPLEATLTAYLHAFAASLVSAGLRAIPLGQSDGQRCLAALETIVHRAVAASLDRDPEDFGACTVALDLLSMTHETQYTRLFRS